MNYRHFEIVINILFWLLSASLLVSSFSVQFQEVNIVNGIETHNTIRNPDLMKSLLFCVACSFFLFYFNLFNLLRLLHRSKNIQVILISCFLLLFFATSFFIAQTILFPVRTWRVPFPLAIGIFLFYSTISTIYGLVKLFIHNERKTQQILDEKNQYQLTLLRSQLQPHFLFNALNNLLSMVDQKHSPGLSNAIDKLSGLLRYVVDESKENKVTIEKEIEFIKNYIGLQLLRFETDEVNCKVTVEGEYSSQKVEPGLFVNFVENAFKYGTFPESKSSITILFDLRNTNQVIFRIENNIPSTNIVSNKNGTGINAVRERLNIIYPRKHNLFILKKETYLVELKIVTSNESVNN